jgi:creatinine amidohydrolase/Fe(II)-dependent formamide hydrolase-like protein
MPVLPFTPNRANPELPGTIGLTPELLGPVLERIADQTIANGFKNVILMGDHGGGQPDVYRAVAKTLDDKYGAQGIHVYYCDEVYNKANDEFNRQLAAEGYPPSLHGGIPDTSLMMYFDGGTDVWVRKNLVPTALGDPASFPKPGEKPQVNNGIFGDARRSSAALGKRLLDLKVEYAVAQIQGFLKSASAK